MDKTHKDEDFFHGYTMLENRMHDYMVGTLLQGKMPKERRNHHNRYAMEDRANPLKKTSLSFGRDVEREIIAVLNDVMFFLNVAHTHSQYFIDRDYSPDSSYLLFLEMVDRAYSWMYIFRGMLAQNNIDDSEITQKLHEIHSQFSQYPGSKSQTRYSQRDGGNKKRILLAS